MSNPILCYITPNCGLQIKVEIQQNDDPTDYGGMRYYTITNLSDIQNLPEVADIQNEKYTKGEISPLNKLSLPPHQRMAAGIPEEAEYYAFAHPPPNLLDIFGDYKDVMQELSKMNSEFVDDSSNDSSGDNLSVSQRFFGTRQKSLKKIPPPDMTRETTAVFATFGAFFYFSKKKDVVSVNVLSFNKTNFSLRLAGPFDASKQASTEMIGAKRVKENRLPHYNECGIIGMVSDFISRVLY